MLQSNCLIGHMISSNIYLYLAGEGKGGGGGGSSKIEGSGVIHFLHLYFSPNAWPQDKEA